MNNKNNNYYNPILKLLLSQSNRYINLLRYGELFHVDLVNGIARRVNKSDRIHDDYPFYYSECKSIEDYLLFLFCQSGLDVKIDSSQKKKRHIVMFSVPSITKSLGS